MSYQTDAIYGQARNTSVMGADMLNSGQASDEFDWGAVLVNGIRGAAYGAMQASVQGAYASGQLQPMPGTVIAQQRQSLVPLLLLGAVAFAAFS